mmetsp:Transcript_3387/g.7994  ORF Transcript_3387/g.7994 Transcript_3387/m.7994 type:complete len:502 (-) Transcript_3387:23-1528(-)
MADDDHDLPMLTPSVPSEASPAEEAPPNEVDLGVEVGLMKQVSGDSVFNVEEESPSHQSKTSGQQSFPREELCRVLLSSLLAHGLKETASTLKKEAGLPGLTPGDVITLTLENDGLPPGAVKGFARRVAQAHALAPHRDSLQESAQKLADQRQRLDALLAKARTIRTEGDTWIPEEGGLKMETEEVLRERLKRQAMEAESIRVAIETRKATQSELERRLEATRKEMRELREKEKDLKPPEQAKLPAPKSEADKIRDVLAHWEEPQGARRAAAAIFARVDDNGDGKLNWNNNEIRRFVAGIFQHCEVALPPWPDSVWYYLYRRCDTDGSISLDFQESLDFARVCFEMAIHAAITAVKIPPLVAQKPMPPARSWADAQPMRRVASQSPSRMEAKTAVEAALRSWNQPGRMQETHRQSFARADVNRDGRLEWASGEVRNFTRDIFSLHSVPLPPWPDQVWFEVFQACDVDRKGSLDIGQAQIFSQHCFELRNYELEASKDGPLS